MNKELNLILKNILVDLPQVDKALDVLAVTNTLTYAYLLLSEQVFSGITPSQSPSDFLNGAHAALKVLSDLPDMLTKIKTGEV